MALAMTGFPKAAFRSPILQGKGSSEVTCRILQEPVLSEIRLGLHNGDSHEHRYRYRRLSRSHSEERTDPNINQLNGALLRQSFFDGCSVFIQKFCRDQNLF
ncbi:hypothetical protein BBP40_006078 [Aspergillus hancockii]|nr:hypothetical protein BBP40_006078 [Aspergillus hancockii]